METPELHLRFALAMPHSVQGERRQLRWEPTALAAFGSWPKPRPTWNVAIPERKESDSSGWAVGLATHWSARQPSTQAWGAEPLAAPKPSERRLLPRGQRRPATGRVAKTWLCASAARPLPGSRRNSLRVHWERCPVGAPRDPHEARRYSLGLRPALELGKESATTTAVVQWIAAHTLGHQRTLLPRSNIQQQSLWRVGSVASRLGPLRGAQLQPLPERRVQDCGVAQLSLEPCTSGL